ncbi:hypothetical protein BA065_01390, partial [Nanoarchaeota archaeon NZ13-N]
DHFYTFCIINKDLVKKSEVSNFLLFMEFLEKTLSEFPRIQEEDFELIKYLLSNLYLIFANQKFGEDFLKYVVYLEEKAKKLEEEGKKIVKDFIDFSSIEDQTIKELNNLRINARILENLFWNAAREINRKEGIILVIPQFLNVLSKFVFWYIAVNFKDKIKYIRRDFKEVKFNEELYKKYLETYKKVTLDDYL